MAEEKAIYHTINHVMKKIGAVSKGHKNQGQGFMYRGIDDVMNELHPIMAECGLFVCPEVLTEERTERQTSRGGVLFYSRLKIKFTFTAVDGSFIEAVVIGEGMDSGDKASNKALAIGFKYALLQVFCIPTEDDKDPDAHSHERASGYTPPNPAPQKSGDIPQSQQKKIESLMVTLDKYTETGVFDDKMQAKIEAYRTAGNLEGLMGALEWAKDYSLQEQS